MKLSEKNKLIAKFWEGNTDLREEEELFRQMSTENPTNQEGAYFRYIAETRIVGSDRDEEIWNTIVRREHHRKRILYLSSGIAASILLLISLFIVTSTYFQVKDNPAQYASNNLKDYYKAFEISKNNNATVYINGCKSSSDFHATLQTINPKCIQHLSISNSDKGKRGNKNKTVDVWLKGKSDEIYSVCEGTLYFYQDGEIKSIPIDDECSPNLLVDCFEIPLSEIKDLKPQQIKSIELTTNPINCSGQLDGEFIVLQSK